MVVAMLMKLWSVKRYAGNAAVGVGIEGYTTMLKQYHANGVEEKVLRFIKLQRLTSVRNVMAKGTQLLIRKESFPLKQLIILLQAVTKHEV